MYFTEKQLRILEFVQEFRAERGISPTLEEIAKHFGVTKITIYEHVNQLERKGAIKREKFRARSIEILVPVEPRGGRYSLPVLGDLREGSPIEATQGTESFNLAEFVPQGCRCFALRVRGDGMAGDHIADGDYVIVAKTDSISNGDVVVAVLEDGQATIKRYFREKNRIVLESPNGGRDTLNPNSAEIRGVVVGVIRKLSQPSQPVSPAPQQ